LNGCFPPNSADNDLRPDVRFQAVAMIERATAMGAERTLVLLARIIHEKCAIKAKSLTSFATMRTGCLMEFFAMKSLAQAFGGLGRFRAI